MAAPICLVDHIFVCTAPGGTAAELLRQPGLTEGTPNRHRGQGAACRRFFFSNAMLELLWLEDEAEARSEQTRATKLWERFSAAGRTVSPFGVVLRPAPGSEPGSPWRSWSYRPQTMSVLELEIAADTGLAEPMWCYMKSGRAPAEWPPEKLQPLDHPAGLREITGVLIGCPDAKEVSVTSAMALNGVISLQTGGGTFVGITVRRWRPKDDTGFPAGPATDFSHLILSVRGLKSGRGLFEERADTGFFLWLQIATGRAAAGQLTRQGLRP